MMPRLALVHDREPLHTLPDLLRRLAEIQSVTRQILDEAREFGNNPMALAAIVRAERQLELEARLVGELQTTTTTNVAVQVMSVESPREAILAKLEQMAQRRLVGPEHPER